MAAGGILGALAASSCCILPLLFLSVGISGAWMGNLTAMAPYQPFFTAITFGFLGYGYYLVYFKPRQACADGDVCGTPVSHRITKIALFAGTLLVLAATVAQYIPSEYLEFL
jgi:mercuric ion transport protein